ncbi:putative bifunctional diguanylate cyclase/phosphodiesterase [Sphingomonas corticis]|jgi:diguanylate cyclase (GGDEF)-like protein|uniref:Bifunctional diguanylate cyclase/phosphodiesterase n=1 Tax=Sphingomonas corticis TaxID=2722791 RepID=A0ABX1CQE4_9SPHN|nr:bifunctional diguanylate cyclase/phosphodiesterase [Sphingomonas corticis]NJR80172.1 bifunctional diguanylate cyclase/phosphodiesterase [Sphingomonas corticis]
MRILIVDEAEAGLRPHAARLGGAHALVHAPDTARAVALARAAAYDVAILHGAAVAALAPLRALDPALYLIAVTSLPVAAEVTHLPDAAALPALIAAIDARRTAERALAEATEALAEKERRAAHDARHDALTGLPNRRHFREAVAARILDGGRFAVAMLDLDRFRLVNDTLGHRIGDGLIRATARALCDGLPGGLVARLGADEFGLLFDAAGAPAAAMECERLVRACGASFDVEGHLLEGAACAGVILGGAQDADADDLLRRADLALGDAKSQGQNHVCLFDEALDEALRLRHRIESGLAQAIGRGELAMVFQPILARDGLDVAGFEALLRWDTEEWGTISPATFIPVAEETALIHALGDWVLERSLAAVADWPGQYVSVNFSPRQFRRPNFVGYVVERCQRAGVAPSRLQIEITETAIFDDVDHAADTLYRLRQMGFRIALDDFGTGYSSLYNIRKFPLDVLKIDRSFVDAMVREPAAAAAVQAVVHLAGALGLDVVAEGVETPAQVDLLRATGVSHLQGFHFGYPLTRDDASKCAIARSIIQDAPDCAAPQRSA